MDLIKRLFGGGPKLEQHAPSELDARPDSKLPELDPQATTRRELVRVVTRDTLRSSGIPDSWIETQILMEMGRIGTPALHLRLVVKHWDPRLLKYAVAFQRKLMTEIEQFEPDARDWLLSIAWQYQVDTECPFLEMPDFASWATPAAPPARSEPKSTPVPRDELQEDLAQLYAVRDANLAAQPAESGGRREDSTGKKPIIPDVLI